MNIDGIVYAVREFARGDDISFSIRKKKSQANWKLRIFGPDKREKLISLGTPDKKIARDIEAEVRSRLNRVEISGILPYPTERLFDEWLMTKEKEAIC